MSNEINYIDTAILDSLSQFLNPEKLQSLMQRYIEDSRRILEQLTESLACDDAEVTRRHIHSLKSTSANVGATQLATLSAELEEYARLEQLGEVKAHKTELNQLFELTSQSIGQLELMQQQQTGEPASR